ncbi:50S ribosomal protein L17 [Desulfonema ishimotonii]|uniref:Large ribosomal subunit protein bL17 n=1 Tax=Desulfonema ishimotonii TaxID=45657 RepID=A0A401G076_9BACT|nr:50S ribosomal protein L17 [Desulfonema ishimotonii]GBC62642.1 50S ribosomal protein L17 [Desulfonema ishimotonii]
MRHRKAGSKLGRTSSHRKAMFRNMVTSLFKYDRIRTTDAKAKALRGWADHLITLAKRGDLHARRQALSIVREKNVVHQLFAEATERYGDIAGGYTRIIKLGIRPGDTAPMSLIELVAPEKGKQAPTEKKTVATEVKAPEKSNAPAKQEIAEKEAETVAAASESVQTETEPQEESAEESGAADTKEDK